jgi:predicted DNA-binding protein (MmcQ/YjbR family)
VSRAEQRLARLTKICLALPEAEATPSGQHCAYAVRGKKFAYYLNDHHGDGEIALCCKVPPGENTQLVEFDAKRFFIPAYLGAKGWVALRLDGTNPDWEEVTELVTDSYRRTAPKRLTR